MSLKCLIVDDEPVAQGILERYVNEFDALTLVAKCENAIAANNWLLKEEIDLIFLDIEMPHLDGISFLNGLSDPPKIILTTAYREYALEGFELNVVDYLLKPISFERFMKAANRVLDSPNTNVEKPQAIAEDYIYLKADKKMIQVYYNDILYIEGLSNYVRIFTCIGRPIISYQKLSYLENALPSKTFIRCHKSYIISIPQIRSYNSTHLDIGENEIPIGGSYRDLTLQVLKQFEA